MDKKFRPGIFNAVIEKKSRLYISTVLTLKMLILKHLYPFLLVFVMSFSMSQGSVCLTNSKRVVTENSLPFRARTTIW